MYQNQIHESLSINIVEVAFSLLMFPATSLSGFFLNTIGSEVSESFVCADESFSTSVAGA